MTIIRKVIINGAERHDDLSSTLLEVAIIDFDTADPPASKQVGQSFSIQVEDDDSYNGAKNLEEFLEMILEECRDLILSGVVAPDLIAAVNRRQRRAASHG